MWLAFSMVVRESLTCGRNYRLGVSLGLRFLAGARMGYRVVVPLRA